MSASCAFEFWQVTVTEGCDLLRLPQVTGGRNGYGAKLANIFSTEFVIETCDGRRKRAYRQVFSANMTAKGEPQISPCKVHTCCAASPHRCVDGRSCLKQWSSAAAGMLRLAVLSPAVLSQMSPMKLQRR